MEAHEMAVRITFILFGILLAVSLLTLVSPTSAAQPQVTLSTQKVTAGQAIVGVYGSGFAPNSNVTINLLINGTVISQPAWTVPTNSQGVFSASINIPSYLTAGKYTVRAVDTHGNIASAVLSVASPTLQPSYSLFYNVIYFLIFFALIFFQPQIQTMMYRGQIERAIRTLTQIEDDSRNAVKQAALQGGASQQSVDKAIQDILETFTIEPVERDPNGVLGRLDHILNVRNLKSKGMAKKIAPNLNGAQLENFEVSLEAAWATHYLSKVIRHYYLTAKKTNNFYLYLQLSMIVPMVLEVAKIYKRATKQFLLGVPVGDGIGSLIAVNLLKGAKMEEIEEETEYGEVQLEGRRILVVKAKGPGATVGKPGKAIAKLVEMNGGRVTRIITVDAALKLEGEKTGAVAEGVGAAIGDPGPEKFAIEEVATRFRIPLDALIVKQSEEEAITAMKKSIADSVPTVIEALTTIIRERTNPGDTVVVAGIGNTAGVP
ncbi:MAG: DUF1512 family protein [Thermoprotei archaeon]